MPFDGSNLVIPPPTGQRQLLNQWFRQSSKGTDLGIPGANTLFNFSQGQLPQSMTDWITASTNEQFGKLGARFGTDLATSISRGLGQAASQNSLQAINSILGLGGTTAGFQFQAEQNALDRALKEYGINSQMDLTMQLLPLLLGGGLA